MSTTQFDNKCYRNVGDTGPMFVPGEPESGVRVKKSAVVGLLCFSFLIVAGIAVNLYFIISVQKECVLAMKGSSNDSENKHRVLPRLGLQDGNNLTDTEVISLLNIVTHLENLDASVQKLTIKMDDILNEAQTEKQAFVQFVSSQNNKLDSLTQKTASISGTLEVFEKKLDQMDNNVIASRIPTLEKHKRLNESDLEETKTVLGDLSTSMTSIENRLWNLGGQLTLTKDSIAAISSIVSGTVMDTLGQLHASVTLNGEQFKMITDKVETISNSALNQQVETSHRLDNITNKMDSGFARLERIESDLDGISITVNMSRDNSTLNVTLQEHAFETRKAIETTAVSIKQGTESNKRVLELVLSNTERILRRFDTIQHSVRNISDHLTFAVDTSLPELDRKVGIVLDLPRVLQETEQNIKASITQFMSQQESNYDQTFNNISAVVGRQSTLFQLELDNSFTKSFEYCANFTGRQINELSQLSRSINDLVNTSTSISIVEKLSELQQFNALVYTNLSNTIQAMSDGESGSDIVQDIARKVDVVTEMLEVINTSLALPSNKLENVTLSMAILEIRTMTGLIHEAVMAASREPPTCRADGCFYKTIPVGLLPPSSTLVQKEDVRLANAQVSSGGIRGRLEVYRAGSWGTVCDDSFGNVDATVVCRMFGYTRGAQKQSAFFGIGTGSILMDDVACSGGESSIFSCRYASNHNCGHTEDVGIICT